MLIKIKIVNKIMKKIINKMLGIKRIGELLIKHRETRKKVYI